MTEAIGLVTDSTAVLPGASSIEPMTGDPRPPRPMLMR